MTFIKPDEWRPSEGIRIEGKALEIVKSEEPVSILAGPGSGKTELLAQKATFFLTTGLCPPPRKILAIAFKVDAARNLQERVSERCDPTQAKRFESFTLDAFAKKLVDQFLEALPDQLRPTSDYRILFPNRDIWQEFGDKYNDTYPAIRGKNDTQIQKLVHQSVPIPQLEGAMTQDEQIHWAWWNEQIHVPNSSRLTFDMIKLLAIYILKNQNCILSALQKTYSHVFLDEFQDVNTLQYELVKTAFLHSDSVLTAVGDSNQAIMRWAGARKDIFDQFEDDFCAKDERLLFNFRSNVRIVELINSLASSFDDYIPTECARKDDPVQVDAVQDWVFDTRQAEGEFLASYIAKELRNNPDLSPADFVILARLRVNDVEDRIKSAFTNQGLRIRNEAKNVGGIAIQDLVKEKAYSFLLSALKLTVNVREGQPFNDCINTIADVYGADLDSDKGHSDALNAVRNLVADLKNVTGGKSPTEVSGRELADCILTHTERKVLQRTYKEYGGGDRLDSVISGFEVFFDQCREGSHDWSDTIFNMQGINSVRLMTIHKSKGLEYHSVIFVELNDDSFWGNEDDINVFFVALSRAKERVCFSITHDSRGVQNVKTLCRKLQEAGVDFKNI